MGTASQAIAYAKSQVGTSSGRGYWKIVRGYESDADWCAIFDSAILIKTNTKSVYFPNNFAFDRRDMSIIGNRWVDKYELQPGDMVSFDFDGGGEWGGDHVGIVVQRYGRGDYQTIEGNCGKQVKYKHRTVSGDGIIGGIRPYYSDEPEGGKLAVDGIFGPNTVKALQTRLKQAGAYEGGIDGDFGTWSKKALQSYLRGKGYYTSSWLIDGWFGPASVKALQSYLRALGEYGSGYLIDGDWGKYTTMALQRALNRGVF